MLAKIIAYAREGSESRPDFSSEETRIYVRTKKNFLPKKTGITSEGKYNYLRMKINFSSEEKPARREKDKITRRKTREETNCCEKKRNFAFKI